MKFSDKSINIMFVDHESRLGGAELSMVDIISTVHDEKFVFSAAIPSAGILEKSLKTAGAVKVLFLRMDSWRWWEQGLIGRVKLILSIPVQIINIARWYLFFKREHPDIIHFNLTRIIEPLIAGKLSGIPTIMHFREDPVNNSAFWGGNYLLYKFLNLADFWVANSMTTQQYIKNQTNEKQISVIPNGIETLKFSPDKAKRRKKFTVLKLAGLVPWKNHELFLRIAAEVLEIEPNIEFLIAGTGHPAYENHLKELARELGILSSVKFIGFVDDTAKLLNEVHLLLHTSGRETFGRVYIEAMACEIPVIAIKGGTADEIIENGVSGYTYHVSEVKNVVKKIIELSKNSYLYNSIATQGRVRVVNHYSLQKLATSIRSYYQTINSV